MRIQRTSMVLLGLLPAAAASTVAGLVLACSASASSAPAPGSSWQKVSPASVGLDPKALDQVAKTAQKGRSSCLVVVRDGKLAGEWYWGGSGPNTVHDVYSATKSVASTLVGIARDDAALSIGVPASDLIPSWQGTPSAAVTIRDLLSMDSGRQWSFQSDYVGLLQAADRTAYATGRGQSAAPGATWTYNNAAVQTLDAVLAQATGQDVATYAQQRLFGPLGMAHTHLGSDRAGNAQLFEGLQSTCRDLARFGVLMLDQGAWHGRQLVSKGWVQQATGRSSTKLNAGYGYLWWLNREGTLASPYAAISVKAAKHPTSTKGRIVPGAPAGLYWALELGNQLIQIDPATRTVVVRLGKPEPDPQPPTFGPKEASAVVTQAVTKR